MVITERFFGEPNENQTILQTRLAKLLKRKTWLKRMINKWLALLVQSTEIQDTCNIHWNVCRENVSHVSRSAHCFMARVYSNHDCGLLNYIYFYNIITMDKMKHKRYNAVIFVVCKPWNLTPSSQKASFLIKPRINYACACGSGCAVFMNISRTRIAWLWLWCWEVIFMFEPFWGCSLYGYKTALWIWIKEFNQYDGVILCYSTMWQSKVLCSCLSKGLM